MRKVGSHCVTGLLALAKSPTELQVMRKALRLMQACRINAGRAGGLGRMAR